MRVQKERFKLAVINKQLNNSKGSSGIQPWSLGTIGPNGTGVAVPSNGHDGSGQKTTPTTTSPGQGLQDAVIGSVHTQNPTTDATQHSPTSSVLPNGSKANAGVDNALGGAVDSHLTTVVGGPVNYEPADVSTYGGNAAGYSIKGKK